MHYFYTHKPGPHAAMLYTCDGVFHVCCDARKSHAMCCYRKFNMLNVFLSILQYLSYVLSDYQVLPVFSIMIDM